jgi:hypothetical protein
LIANQDQSSRIEGGGSAAEQVQVRSLSFVSQQWKLYIRGLFTRNTNFMSPAVARRRATTIGLFLIVLRDVKFMFRVNIPFGGDVFLH